MKDGCPEILVTKTRAIIKQRQALGRALRKTKPCKSKTTKSVSSSTLSENPSGDVQTTRMSGGLEPISIRSSQPGESNTTKNSQITFELTCQQVTNSPTRTLKKNPRIKPFSHEVKKCQSCGEDHPIYDAEDCWKCARKYDQHFFVREMLCHWKNYETT